MIRQENKKNEKKIMTLGEVIVSYIKSIVIAVIVTLIINQFFYITIIQGESMQPTLVEGDILLVRRFALDDIEINDLIIFDEIMSYRCIKRVVACGGDVVRIDGNELYVNGEKVNEPYIGEWTYEKYIEDFEVSEDCYFVLGDNRDNSIDSRWVGEIKAEQVVGVVVFK